VRVGSGLLSKSEPPSIPLYLWLQTKGAEASEFPRNAGAC
jgi:hypothetical protein